MFFFSYFVDAVVQILFAHSIQLLENFQGQFQDGELSNPYQVRDGLQYFSQSAKIYLI